jgi:predicted nuclease of predicted toxin-antitoxin system
MKIKIDENLGKRGVDLFLAAGHDVISIPGQNMSSASDRELIDICCQENRCLVTLDLDFSNPLLFKPSEYQGIAVLRLPPKAAPTDLYKALATLIRALETGDIRGKLWIVQKDRIREYQED